MTIVKPALNNLATVAWALLFITLCFMTFVAVRNSAPVDCPNQYIKYVVGQEVCQVPLDNFNKIVEGKK